MDPLSLTQLMDRQLMIINSQAQTKEEVLNELCQRLAQEGYVSNAQTFLADVYDREAEGVTGIGGGIAIPHGKSSAVVRTTVAIAKLAQPIQWETLDGADVTVVFLFAVRDVDANTTHILLLQQVAILLADDAFVSQVRQVSTVEALYQLITQHRTSESL